MRYILILLFTCKLILAFPIELNSISSDFTQSIIDDHNKSITYIGKLWAKRPSMAHWSYKKPVQKEIYMNYSKVTIIEPDLEQVIQKEMRNGIDLIKILANSKEISKEHYLARYGEKEYHIYLDDKRLKSLHYRDDFDNKTVINFTNVIQNSDINDSFFEVVIPKDYDLIN